MTSSFARDGKGALLSEYHIVESHVTTTQRTLRLHRNPQRNPSGDFARIASAAKREFKQSAATRAAKHMQPLFAPHRGTKGPGGSSALASPRRLCAAFDARKRPLVSGNLFVDISFQFPLPYKAHAHNQRIHSCGKTREPVHSGWWKG